MLIQPTDNIGQVNGGVRITRPTALRQPANYASGQPLNGLFPTTLNQKPRGRYDAAIDAVATTRRAHGRVFPFSFSDGGPGATANASTLVFCRSVAASVSVAGKLR